MNKKWRERPPLAESRNSAGSTGRLYWRNCLVTEGKIPQALKLAVVTRNKFSRADPQKSLASGDLRPIADTGAQEY